MGGDALANLVAEDFLDGGDGGVILSAGPHFEGLPLGKESGGEREAPEEREKETHKLSDYWIG
jgi:hypothetical protein